MPAAFILHEGDSLSFHRMSEKAFGTPVLYQLSQFNGRYNLLHIISVNLINIKTKCLEFLSKVDIRHNLVGRAVQLKAVVIHKYN